MSYTTEWDRSMARTRVVALGMVIVAAMAVGFAVGRSGGARAMDLNIRLESAGPLTRAQALAIMEGLRREQSQEAQQDEGSAEE